MKKTFEVAALLGLMATGVYATSARAQCGTLGAGLLIDFDQGYAYETGYNVATYSSAPGSQMTCVGRIVLWCDPFADLEANLSNPSLEYTFIITGTSVGTLPPAPFGAGGTKWDTDYTGATFQIYEGTPRNSSDPAAMPAGPPAGGVPGSFTDGTLILQGVFDTFHTQITVSGITGNYGSSVRADYHFTGGTLYGRVGNGESLYFGTWCPAGTGNGRCGIPAGYSAKPNDAWNSPTTTDVQSSTWGAIKQLYR